MCCLILNDMEKVRMTPIQLILRLCSGPYMCNRTALEKLNCQFIMQGVPSYTFHVSVTRVNLVFRTVILYLICFCNFYNFYWNHTGLLLVLQSSANERCLHVIQYNTLKFCSPEQAIDCQLVKTQCSKRKHIVFA